MRLSEAALRQEFSVEQVGGERAFRRRLMELGLVPGTRIELVAIAPLGDPMELLVRGCSLSIRRCDAERITVSAPVLDEQPGCKAAFAPVVKPLEPAGHRL